MRSDLAGDLLRQMSEAVPDDLVRFGKAMEEYLGTQWEWPYFLEKAWKWAAEYTAWTNAGKPQSMEEAEWADFDVAMERLVNA